MKEKKKINKPTEETVEPTVEENVEEVKVEDTDSNKPETKDLPETTEEHVATSESPPVTENGTDKKSKISETAGNPLAVDQSSAKVISVSMRNADRLLTYISEYGLELEEDEKQYVKNIIVAKHAHQHQAWTESVEADFWLAYNRLSKVITPVTINSLKAAEDIELENPGWFARVMGFNKRRSHSRRAVRAYIFSTAFTMLVMLLFQIYALQGTNLLNDVQSNQINMEAAQKRLNELIVVAQVNENMDYEKNALQNQLTSLQMENETKIESLKEWMQVYGAFQEEEKNETKENTAGQTPDVAESIPLPPPLETDDPESAEMMSDPATAAQKSQRQNIVVLQKARNNVYILGFYILPLFYGLLGGFAYVLRSLTKETKELTYTKNANIKYTLRALLGAVAGMAVGLFWREMENQELLGLLESLSPLAIAFIFGYSVEVLFALIDRLMVSVSRREINNLSNNKRSISQEK